MPFLCLAFIALSRTYIAINFEIVVLSPPGIISPSRPSRSEGRRTSFGAASIAERVCMCSLKSPCNARTPIFLCATDISFQEYFYEKLPAAFLQPCFQLAYLEAFHCLAKPC